MNLEADCVSISDLLNKVYIEANAVIDPNGRETMTGSVKITYEANQYTYQYQEESCRYTESILNGTDP